MAKRKYAIFAAAAFAALQLITGCGNDETDTAGQAQQPGETAACCDLSKTKDGTYTAESSADKVHGKSVISLTIKDHTITAVNYQGIDKDGTPKTSDYGKDKDPTNAKKAKIAFEAQQKYADQLLQKQKLAQVDAISGATINYHQFIEAVKKDLEEANK